MIREAISLQLCKRHSNQCARFLSASVSPASAYRMCEREFICMCVCVYVCRHALVQETFESMRAVLERLCEPCQRISNV